MFIHGFDYKALSPTKKSPVSGSGRPNFLLWIPSCADVLQPFSCSRKMAKAGGRQLTLGACGLKKFAETANGRQVQLHIPKYVQGPVGCPCRFAEGRIRRPKASQNNQFRITGWYFLQNPGLEPNRNTSTMKTDTSPRGTPCTSKAPVAHPWRISGRVSYSSVSYSETGDCVMIT